MAHPAPSRYDRAHTHCPAGTKPLGLSRAIQVLSIQVLSLHQLPAVMPTRCYNTSTMGPPPPSDFRHVPPAAPMHVSNGKATFSRAVPPQGPNDPITTTVYTQQGALRP